MHRKTRACHNFQTVLTTEISHSAVWELDDIEADSPWAASFQAIWWMHSTLSEGRHCEISHELILSYDTFPTLEPAITSRAFSQGELPQHHGVPLFKDLRVGDSGVGHV